jgi:DNA polymerase-3 subunit gamma/tau
VLGVADAEQLFGAVEAIVARDPAGALRAAATLADSGRDPGQVLRDLEVHARELLTAQLLGEVPAELRVTPERDRRLLEQAQALSQTDAVRMLDLVATALEATTNGAQARIQLELVLIKAAAPEVDPSTAALLARIERLEAALGSEARSAGVAQTAKSPEATVMTTPQASMVTAPNADLETAPAFTVELQSATEAWPAVVEIVKQGNAMLAALLTGARPVAIDERELTLAFPSDAAFLKRKAEQDDHRRAATEAFSRVSGRRLALRYELRDLEPAAPLPHDGESTLTGEELVRRFLEEFDAEELLDEQENEQREAR